MSRLFRTASSSLSLSRGSLARLVIVKNGIWLECFGLVGPCTTHAAVAARHVQLHTPTYPIRKSRFICRRICSSWFQNNLQGSPRPSSITTSEDPCLECARVSVSVRSSHSGFQSHSIIILQSTTYVPIKYCRSLLRIAFCPVSPSFPISAVSRKCWLTCCPQAKLSHPCQWSSQALEPTLSRLAKWFLSRRRPFVR